MVICAELPMDVVLRLNELGEVERFMKSLLVKKERGLEKKRKFYLDEIARKGRNAAEMRNAVSIYFGELPVEAYDI